MANTRTAIEIAIVDGATKVLNEIKNGTKAVQSSFTELNSALELVGKGFAAIGAAAGFAKDLLQPARDAETAMNRVAVATGATAAELQLLREKSTEIAFDLRVPFDQVAAGAEQLARDGASASDVLANIGPVAAFAKGALLGTAEAAGQLSDVLDGYGEDIANIGAIGDAIVATAGAAGASAADLLEGVKKLGPVATDAGVGINQVVGLLGALAEKGIGGAKAVKALETIFTEFKDPAAGAGEAIRSLGLDAASLPAILQRLSTDSKAAELVLSELGDKPRIALQALLADGGGALTKLTEVINTSSGASAKAAGELGTTFDGAVARIGIALTELQAAFFNPVLAPLAAEIDTVSAKIKEFAGTQDFAGLQAVVIDFVNQTVAQLKQFAASFDFSAAVESTRRFVEDVKVTFAILGEAFGAARVYFNGFLAVVNSVEFAISKLVSGSARLALLQIKAAEAVGITTDANKEYALILEDVIRSAEREAEVNSIDLGDSLGIVTGATQEAAAATIKLATEQRAAAAAAKTQAAAQQEVAAALPPVVSAVDEISARFKKLADSAKEGGKEMKKAAETPAGTLDELRNRLIILNQALVKAFYEGGNTKELQAEIKATEAQVDALTASTAGFGEKAKESFSGASEAASETTVSVEGLAESLDSIDASSAATAAGVGKLAGAVADASQRFVTGTVDLVAFARAANRESLYFEGLTATIDAYAKARSRAAEITIKALEAEVEALDPVSKRLEELRKQFPEATRQALERIKELEEARDRLNGITPGGTGPTQSGPVAQGEGQTRASSGGNNFVINLSLSALDPKSLSPDTLKDFARQISGPLRSFQASGN